MLTEDSQRHAVAYDSTRRRNLPNEEVQRRNPLPSSKYCRSIPCQPSSLEGEVTLLGDTLSYFPPNRREDRIANGPFIPSDGSARRGNTEVHHLEGSSCRT